MSYALPMPKGPLSDALAALSAPDEMGWRYNLATLAISYFMFVSVVMLAWNSTISSTVASINDVCDDVAPGAPASRGYILALFCYGVARTLLLVVVLLIVVYFLSQMGNILVEYLPSTFKFLQGTFRCLSTTDYTFRAIDQASLPAHAKIVGIILAMILALVVLFVTEHDLEHSAVLRQKLTFITLVSPTIVWIAYIATWLKRSLADNEDIRSVAARPS